MGKGVTGKCLEMITNDLKRLEIMANDGNDLDWFKMV